MTMGQVVQVADDGRDEHRPDVGGEGEVEGLKALAQPGPDPHGDEEDDQVLEKDIGFLVLAGGRRFLGLGELVFDDLVGAGDGTFARMGVGLRSLWRSIRQRPDRAADQPAADDPEHGRGHGDRRRPVDPGLFEQRREGQAGRRPAGQGHRTRQDAEQGLKAEGQGDRRAEEVLEDGRDGGDDEEQEDLGAADLEERKAGPEADRGEKGDHQRIAERRVEREQGHVEMAGDEDGEGDEQARRRPGAGMLYRDRGRIQRQRP